MRDHFSALVTTIFDKEPNEKNVKAVIQMAKRLTINVDEKSIKEQFRHFARRFNIEREKLEDELMNALDSVIESNDEVQVTSIMQKGSRELEREIWSQVITTRCPHCKKNSPAIRKDGYTKIFVKPL